MKSFATHIAAACMFASLALAGCSSSEEASKSTPALQPGEFRRVDRDEEVTPIVEPAQKEPELPSTEKNVPAEKPAPQQTAPDAQQETTPPAAQTPAVQKSGMMMWSVQIGAFKMESGAVALINEAKAKFKQPLYKDYDPVTSFYKVTVGSFQTRDQAAQYKTEVQAKGYPDAFTVEVRR